MARKYEIITELYRRAASGVTTPQEWRKFLSAACRNYKLPFDEQLLIYAQRPDATAVLEIERWNKQFGRWVNRGATGIAVFDAEHAGRLKYYFDISDTNEGRFSRPVPLWHMRPEYEPEVIEALENSFGSLADKSDLAEALLSAAKNAVEDNMSDYLAELLIYREGSFLEELDEFNAAVVYRRAAENSIGYMLLARCDIAPSDYFSDDDFRDIPDFNTPETRNALGTLTGDIGKMCLTEIARTVQSLSRNQIYTFAKAAQTDYRKRRENQNAQERSIEHGEHPIHAGGRLPASESAAPAGNGGHAWEVRIASPEIPQAAPESDLYESADIGQAEHTSDGDRADGAQAAGAVDARDGKGAGRDGGAESSRSDEVGRTDEQHQERGGGSDTERADLQLTPQETEPQATVDWQAEGVPLVRLNTNNESAGSSETELPALLDEKRIMAVIANQNDELKYKKQQIALFFSVHPDETERAEYLKSAYPNRYTEIIADGVRIGYKPQENGLLVWEGAYLSRTKETVFSWDLIAGWTAQRIDKKEYCINTAITPPKSQNSQQLTLFDMPSFDAAEPLFPRETLPQQIIDEALCIGANDKNSRLIICAYFMKDKADNARFLQAHYGENGAGFYVNDRRYALWYHTEGIRIAEGETAQRSTTVLTWEQAAVRIRELLDMGRYMPQNEIDRAAAFERYSIAQGLTYIVRDFSEEAKEAGYTPLLRSALSERGGFPAIESRIAELLAEPETLQKITDEWRDFAAAYAQNRELLRFHYHRPKELLQRLLDLQREPLTFTAAEDYDPQRRFFISADEIDKILRGRTTDYRLSVYSFYRNHTDRNERKTFLKNMHGEYSSAHSGNDNLTYQRGKGLLFSHGSITAPYAKAEMKWSAVEKRISALISSGRFLSDEDRAAIPAYEKHRLAQSVSNFFHNVPQEQPRPFPYGFDYWDSVKLVEPMLDDPAKVEELYRMMLPVWESTTQDDRYYELRRQGFENLSAYRNGTFSLFGERKEPKPIEAIQPSTSKAERSPAAAAEPDFSDITQEELPAEKETEAALAPPKPRRERIRFTTLHPEIPAEQRHQYHIADKRLGFGTPGEKFAANAAAIRCLKQIEYEERLATPEEQVTLARYVGWGGLSDCFDERSSHYQELKSLLDAEEYEASRASSLTAFYTSPVITEAIYQALAQMGFQRGNILEPACGVGNFIGSLPESMADSKVYGVEIDSISGRIAAQLYQNSSIAVEGFEKVEMPDSFFDVAVGNVPFGDFKAPDKRYDKHHWLIHDYFFGKALDKVRPGGIVAFITSKGTLDKESSAVRKYLAQRAELIGAIRLPDDAFKRNAGTEVTSDIVFLQKRDRLTDLEPEWVHLDTDENGIRMNRYFVQHPEMILGEMKMESARFGMDSACKAYEGADLSELLQEAIGNLHTQITEYEPDEPLEDEEDRSIPADPEVRNFSYTVKDGALYFRENSLMHPVAVSVTSENRIRGMIALRDCVRQLIEYQTENYPDEIIRREREKLNRLYDGFVKKYGRLFTRGNNLAFCEDSGYCLLCSLEVLDDEGNFKRKADMFSKRTIRPHVPVTHADTAGEALAVSISEKARVDMEYMSELSGKTPEELETELQGVIFRDIVCAEEAGGISKAFVDLQRFPLVTADEYLSGNVRKKLRMARALQEVLPTSQKEQTAPNITALEAVQPQDLTAAEIGVRIGATWIPPEIYKQFMFELLDTGYHARRRMNILYSKHTGEWNISEKSSDYGNIKTVTTYGTRRLSAYHIFEQTLNLKDVRVYDYVEDENGNKRAVLNKKETAIAQDRQELIKQKFSEWVWKDIARRERLCQIYNETFNSIRPREYDGGHIVFHGMNPEITLRAHQVNAIAHILYGGNTLLAHEVGAGKTFEMVAAAMEMKRLGLCSKSLIVVPNHITEQWAAEWLQLYPSANILVATKKDFERQNRKKFCGRIATGEYDAVIIGHSQFEKIPMSAERQRVILQRQIDDILFGIREAKAAKAERYTVKQLEKTKKSLEARLAKLNDQSRKDDLVTFEELGVDRLFVDESHYFKNLFLATKMRNVGGIAQTEAQKSSDLFMKTQYLDELTDGRGVIFATGTPISNSMVELYTIQRYLQYRTLQEMELTHFDEWAANFGETITAIELSPEGSGYRAKTRFAKFYNLPELMSVFKEAADIQTADMLRLPVPKANFHTEVIKPSALQQEMIRGLAERAEKVRNGNVDPTVDNLLKITNDGRKLALDMRLINPLAPDDENGKVSACARNIFRIWEASKDKRSAQMVFCDLSTPKGIVETEQIDGVWQASAFQNVYDDLRLKLMNMGIPAEEIAFIHDANTEAKKKELFAKVRSGQVRVLMGSTQKMGAGTNAQDKLIALHDLDCPWRPSDLAQRLGRIVRQGNENTEVDIFRYVTENTFDAYLYQLVENKQKFIAQIMTSKTPLRAAEDVDETALSYSEIKALATGNPLIIEKCELDMQVGKLNMLKASHLSQKYALEGMVLRKYPEALTRLTERIAGYEKDVQLAAEHPKPQEGFVGMEILSVNHTEKESAGRAILDACTKMTGSDAVALGQYRGFSLTLFYDGTSNEYRMTMKGTLSHTVVLGADVFGNITRMDNALEGLAGKLDAVRQELESTKTQLANAREEMEAPFSREAELQQKTARLKELNILLNMDEKDKTLLDPEPDEEIEAPERKTAEPER